MQLQPRFHIASWTFGDGHGQGIDAFIIKGNATGVWETIYGPITNDDPGIFNWSAGVGIKLYCYTWFNSTFTGATSGTNGRNFQRHNVTVTNTFGDVVFSKQNLTWYSTDTGIDPPMWFYEYYVVLNFLPTYGECYAVTVTYQIYW
jgi:hypothetical protein